MPLHRILVPVKRVIDFTVKVRVKADGTGVETDHVKMSLNPFDEIALEEAVRLKEANLASEIIAVSIGPAACQETLRGALARGADRAILIATDSPPEPFGIATILKEMILRESGSSKESASAQSTESTNSTDSKNSNPIDLVIMGKQAIDDDANQTGQMLAGLLNWAQGTFTSKLTLNPSEPTVTVVREVDGGLETLKLKLPAIITTDLRLNEPRYISLPNVVKAKTKPLQTIPLADLNLSIKTHTQILKVEPPPARKGGVKVKTVQELLDKLIQEAKVI